MNIERIKLTPEENIAHEETERIKARLLLEEKEKGLKKAGNTIKSVLEETPGALDKIKEIAKSLNKKDQREKYSGNNSSISF